MTARRPSARELRAVEAAKQRTVEAQAEFGRVTLSFNRAALVEHVEAALRAEGRWPAVVAKAIASVAANEFQIRMRETLPGHVDQELLRAVAAAFVSVVTDGANLSDAVTGSVTWTEDDDGVAHAVIEGVRSDAAQTWPNLLRSLPSGKALKRSELNPLMGALRRIVASKAKADLPMKTGRPKDDARKVDARNLSYFHRHSELKKQNQGIRAPAEAARLALCPSEFASLGVDGERARLRHGKRICQSRGCHPELHPSKG